VRAIDEARITAAADIRFRSEYHYAVFEYWRSAKVLRYLERRGVTALGDVLDAGCGGGGMCVSFAEEAASVVGIDLADRFHDAGTRLGRERRLTNLRFAQADGTALPFPAERFDVVFSHAVIEHVANPLAYLAEIRRVVKPRGRVFLQTAPYLSPHGSHLPRLKIPVPLHLVFGRRAAFAASKWLARHVPSALAATPDGSSFLTLARAGADKIDDLTYKVTVRNLRETIRAAGFAVLGEDLYVSRSARRLAGRFAGHVSAVPVVRDIFVSNMEYLLAPREA
jgi:ubiquinone/menaquinone biosynthesis C-methylase UbiE